MVGYARKQRAARHIIEPGDVALAAAFLRQFLAEIGNRGIVDVTGEVEQDAIGSEIGLVLRIEVSDGGEVAVVEKRCPKIVGAHLHAAFVLADRRRREFPHDFVFGRIVIQRIVRPVLVVREMAPHVVHSWIPIILVRVRFGASW